MNWLHCASASSDSLENKTLITLDNPERSLSSGDYLLLKTPSKKRFFIHLSSEKDGGFSVEYRTSPLITPSEKGTYVLSYSDDWLFVMKKGGGHGFHEVYSPPGVPN